jgi:molecular chaperone Hsp33
MTALDFTQKFTFDSAPVRGRIVRLGDSLRKLRGDHGYGAGATRILGQLAVAAVTLAQDLKFDGRLIVQLRSAPQGTETPLSTAMAECRGGDTLRGIVRGSAILTAPAGDELHALFGGGDLAITLKPERGETYQGVVAIAEGGLAAHLERYFEASEQLPTRIWLASERDAAAALLLQRLPGAVIDERDVDDWRRFGFCADTLSPGELLHLPVEVLLDRLFGQDRVRVHPPQRVQFGCSCTRERSSNALKLLGRETISEILAAVGMVDVTCEFCGAVYHYDAFDANALLRDAAAERPDTIH